MPHTDATNTVNKTWYNKRHESRECLGSPPCSLRKEYLVACLFIIMALHLDFSCCPNKIQHMKGKRFRNVVISRSNTWCVQVLRSPKEAFAAAMQSWRERCEKMCMTTG